LPGCLLIILIATTDLRHVCCIINAETLYLFPIQEKDNLVGNIPFHATPGAV
jgi:hypothetical protein